MLRVLAVAAMVWAAAGVATNAQTGGPVYQKPIVLRHGDLMIHLRALEQAPPRSANVDDTRYMDRLRDWAREERVRAGRLETLKDDLRELDATGGTKARRSQIISEIRVVAIDRRRAYGALQAFLDANENRVLGDPARARHDEARAIFATNEAALNPATSLP